MNKHPDCEDRCQILEHKGYHDCAQTGRCELLDAAHDSEGMPFTPIHHHGECEVCTEIYKELSALRVENERLVKDCEQYRKNWLAFQDLTGEQCMELALPIVEGWRDAFSLREKREGWMMVPKEPTEKMKKAGDSVCSAPIGQPLMKVIYPAAVGPEDVYKAMLAVSEEKEPKVSSPAPTS